MEFALVVPLLIFLLFAIISYGYMLSFRQAISQGAAEGARAAAVAPAGYTTAKKTAAARAAVDEALKSYGVTCSGTDLLKDGDVGSCAIWIGACPAPSTKQCVSVTLDYEYRDHALVPGLSLPGLDLVMPSNLRYTAVAEVS